MHGSVYFILSIYVNILCMGVYVYIYIYIYIYIYVCVCVCVYICMYACIHMQVFNGFPYAKVFHFFCAFTDVTLGMS